MPRDRKDGLRVGSLDGSGLDPARIEAMVQGIARGDYPDVHSVLVVKSGALVLEEYFYEYSPDTLHPLRSATKSVVSALAGVAIDNGLLAGVHEPVLPHFEPQYGRIENVTDAKRRITLEHLLTNSSGLDCDDYDPKSAGNESLMGRADDWVKFILDLPMIEEPGGTPRYCSGGVITTGRIIEKVSGMPLEAFARRHLFDPLGIRPFEWRFEPDRSSSETFCQVSLRPRDMAKFGLLFLHGGQWNGRRVLSKEWVEASTRPHTIVDNTDYGYLWWRPYLDVGGRRHHAILATGNGGQKIYLWPELDMIVVLTGGNYNRQSPAKELLTRDILPAA
jgi:CubicO group peptidase (beta-lactamase class C family)